MQRLDLRKKAFWCAVVTGVLASGLVVCRLNSQSASADQLASVGMPSTGLASHVVKLEGGGTRVVVIDPQLRSMGVYDLGQNGEINLKSVRRFSADLQMLEFNSGEPSPEDIQQRLDQR